MNDNFECNLLKLLSDPIIMLIRIVDGSPKKCLNKHSTII